MSLQRSLLAIAATALLAIPVSAQERGTITGQVTDAATMQPLSGAQVVIEGTNFGALANEAGRFLIPNVPAGTHTLRAIMIGYGPETVNVTVAAGQTAAADFRLSQSAIQLDAVVVTATGEQRKREIGNAVGTIDAAALTEIAPVTSMATLLQGRTAGVQVFGSAGTSGAGSRIRIRGSSSISLSNDPLVYVDGIRVDNRQSGLGAGGQESSRLDDFNPEDIESIEIVKGPAAATLYGTEAANGVIRITTKRGRPGDTRWNVWVEGGLVQERNTYPLNYSGLDSSSDDFARACILEAVALGDCTQTGLEAYQVLRDPNLSPIDDGSRRQLGFSVQGGSERVNYYISGELEGEIGPFSLPDADRQDLLERGVPITDEVERPNQLDRANIRINVNSQIAEDVTLAVRAGYLDSHFAFTGNDNNSFGFLPSAFFGGSSPDNRPWGFQRPAQLFGRTFYQDVQRFTTGATATYQPTDWLSTRLTGGVDFSNRQDVSFFQRDIGVPGQSNLGRKDSDFRNTWQYTLDASATGSFDLTDNVSSKTSVGAQYFRNLFTGTFAWGIDIVTGSSSIGSAAQNFSNETTTEDKTAGVFFEQVFGWNDRLFVTGAVRADDNSAFGRDFDLIVYPKAAVSWILSEEEFFPASGFIDQLRLRAAWGKSGLQPGSDDAIRTLSADAVTSPDDETISGVRIGEIGNSLLEPEESEEFEIGLDADLAGGRLGLELTYYDKNTNGALIEVPLAPSLGASPDRWINIGEVENKGFEAAINAAVLELDNFGWDFTLSGSINNNELLSLGEGTEPIGSQTRFVPGFPLGGQWAERIVSSSDTDGNGILTADEIVVGDTIEFFGAGMPEQEVSLSTTVTLFNSLRIFGLFDYRGDYVAYNNTERFRCRFELCRALVDPSTPLAEQERAVASLYHPSQTVAGYLEDADFIKFRELSVSYQIPTSISQRFRSDRATVTLTGRNLATWTDYTGMDPEINSAGSGDNFGISEFLTQPPVRYWTLRFNFGF